MISLCPDSTTLDDYKEAVKNEVTLDDMTADQSWCDFHIRECDECKEKVEA
jgi:hypothetical protein